MKHILLRWISTFAGTHAARTRVVPKADAAADSCPALTSRSRVLRFNATQVSPFAVSNFYINLRLGGQRTSMTSEVAGTQWCEVGFERSCSAASWHEDTAIKAYRQRHVESNHTHWVPGGFGACIVCPALASSQLAAWTHTPRRPLQRVDNCRHGRHKQGGSILPLCFSRVRLKLHTAVQGLRKQKT